MRILSSVYNKIIMEISIIPPETGGIIGGTDGIVSVCQFDKGLQSDRMCSYVPDTKMLNNTIKVWQDNCKEFMGIYHVHFFDVDTFSKGDLKYIDTILKNMPKNINKLYFPLIVMPKRYMAVYTAMIISGKLVINKEDVDLIEDKKTCVPEL